VLSSCLYSISVVSCLLYQYCLPASASVLSSSLLVLPLSHCSLPVSFSVLSACLFLSTVSLPPTVTQLSKYRYLYLVMSVAHTLRWLSIALIIHCVDYPLCWLSIALIIHCVDNPLH
jgi:hypothetical protein